MEVKTNKKINTDCQVRYAYARKKEVLRAAVEMRKPMAVFCATQGRAEDTARIFCAYFGSGKAKFYHEGLTKEEKSSVLKWFCAASDGILVATSSCVSELRSLRMLTAVYMDENASVSKGIFGGSVHSARICYENGRARDAEIAMEFIRANRRLCTMEEIVRALVQIFNKADLCFFKVNVWEARDVQEILSRLLSEGRIRIMGGLWKGRVDISSPRSKTGGAGKITPVRRRLHSLCRLFRKLLEKLERAAHIFS